jgi:chromosome transmission fidelity protein 4
VCRCPPPTELQKPFHPGSTPEILTSRFMAYNLVGLVRQNNEDDLSTIDVEFHNASHHHSIHLSNHLSHTMASLSETALLLACHSTEDVCSKLQCLHFGSWDTAKEWVCSMANGEDIEVTFL